MIKLVKKPSNHQFRAMFEQCPKFRDALVDTESKKLFHNIGKTNPRETILIEKEFCSVLTELRKELYDKYGN